MSSNSDNSSIGLIIGMVGAAIMVFWIAIFAVFTFLAFALTIMSLMAWRKPLHFGRWVITPEEAHGFVKRGLAGAFVLPAFALFVEVFLGLNLNWDFLPYLIVGGYAIGSLGIEILIQHQIEKEREAAEATAVQVINPTDYYRAVPGPESEPQPPFTYATWDDEEKRR